MNAKNASSFMFRSIGFLSPARARVTEVSSSKLVIGCEAAAGFHGS